MLRLVQTTALLASLLFAFPAEARFITLPSGIDPLSYRHANRKVIPQGTRINNQPWRQRNEQRKMDLKLIGNALARYRRAERIAPKHILITEEQEICRWDADDCNGLVDLQETLSPYMDNMPADPDAEGNGTGYVVKKDYRERVFLRSIKAEQGWLIRLQN